METVGSGVAHTSLVGGITMAAATLIIFAVLPGRRGLARTSGEPSVGIEATTPDPTVSTR